MGDDLDLHTLFTTSPHHSTSSQRIDLRPTPHRQSAFHRPVNPSLTQPFTLRLFSLSFTRLQFRYRSKNSESDLGGTARHVTALFTRVDRRPVTCRSTLHSIAQHGLHQDINSSLNNPARLQSSALKIATLFWTSRCRKIGRQPSRV